MMRYYCPSCWAEYFEEHDICPDCGYNIKEYNEKGYVDKLINALNHKAGEIRHLAIMILVLRKEKKALPYLKIISETSDDIGLKKSAAEAVRKIEKG